MTAPARYTLTAISLHWLVTFLILAAFPLGLYYERPGFIAAQTQVDQLS